MNAIVNQNFVVYRHLSKERLLVNEGDTAEVVWKEDIRSKVVFLDGEAKHTSHVIDNMLLDFVEE
nr:hypothetical protein [Mycobacterium sp. E3298]